MNSTLTILARTRRAAKLAFSRGLNKTKQARQITAACNCLQLLQDVLSIHVSLAIKSRAIGSEDGGGVNDATLVRALHSRRWGELAMMYTLLDRIAQKLGTDEETLRRFHQFGWISIVEKGGAEYLASQQEYKAKFILYLQRERRLDSADISRVLAEQEPPYSAANVDLVLSSARTARRVH